MIHLKHKTWIYKVFCLIICYFSILASIGSKTHYKGYVIRFKILSVTSSKISAVFPVILPCVRSQC